MPRACTAACPAGTSRGWRKLAWMYSAVMLPGAAVVQLVAAYPPNVSSCWARTPRSAWPSSAPATPGLNLTFCISMGYPSVHYKAAQDTLLQSLHPQVDVDVRSSLAF